MTNLLWRVGVKKVSIPSRFRQIFLSDQEAALGLGSVSIPDNLPGVAYRSLQPARRGFIKNSKSGSCMLSRTPALAQAVRLPCSPRMMPLSLRVLGDEGRLVLWRRNGP